MKKISFLIAVFLSVFTMFVGQAQAAEERYIGFTEYLGHKQDHVFYVKPEDSEGTLEKQLVYCFNLTRINPLTETEKEYALKYIKHLADGHTLSSLTSGTNKLTGVDLEKAVTNVIYNGYGIDALKLKEKYQMTDFQFNQVTQQAVWYYTEGKPSFYVPSRLEELGNSENLIQAYKILIGQDPTTSLKEAPADLKLNIYQSENKSYQNLLGTSFVNPTTGEVVLEGDKVPNPNHPTETTTPSVEESTPSEPVEETTETTTPSVDESTPSEPVEETTETTMPSVDESTPSEPVEETTETTTPSVDESTPSEPVEETTETTTPSVEESTPSEPVEETTETTTPSVDESTPSEPVEETTETTTPSVEESTPSEPVEETTETTTPSVEESTPSEPVVPTVIDDGTKIEKDRMVKETIETIPSVTSTTKEETIPSEEESTNEVKENNSAELPKNLPNTGSQSSGETPKLVAPVASSTPVANQVTPTNKAMLPKTGTQSNVALVALGFGLLGLAFISVKRQRKTK